MKSYTFAPWYFMFQNEQLLWKFDWDSSRDRVSASAKALMQLNHWQKNLFSIHLLMKYYRKIL